MRFIFGVVIGIFVSIGVAYVHDNSLPGPERAARAVVNWDNFNTETRGIGDAASTAWDRLMALVRRKEG